MYDICLRCACVSHTVSWANTPVKLVIRMPPIADPLMDGSRVDRDARVSMCLCVFKWPSMPFAVTSWSARRVCSGLGASALCFLTEPRPPSGLCIYICIYASSHDSTHRLKPVEMARHITIGSIYSIACSSAASVSASPGICALGASADHYRVDGWVGGIYGLGGWCSRLRSTQTRCKIRPLAAATTLDGRAA